MPSSQPRKPLPKTCADAPFYLYLARDMPLPAPAHFPSASRMPSQGQPSSALREQVGSVIETTPSASSVNSETPLKGAVRGWFRTRSHQFKRL